MVSYLSFPGLDQSGLSPKQFAALKTGFKGHDPMRILSAICDYYGLPLEEVIGKSRKQEYSWCRQVFCFLCVKHTKMTKNQISQFVGRSEHSTTVHSEQTVRDILETEPDKIKDLKEIEYLFMYGPAIGKKKLIPSK